MQHLVSGCRARIQGLVGAPRHNGKEGVLVAFIEDTGRWSVEVGEPELLSVKPANLLFLSMPQAPTVSNAREQSSSSHSRGSSSGLTAGHRQQNENRPACDVAAQPQMTKPFSQCSLPDLVHEISLVMPSTAALLLPRLNNEDLVDEVMHFHPLIQGASGLQCTDTVESKRAWCNMLRHLTFSASRITVNEDVLFRVYAVCEDCARRGLVRLSDASVHAPTHGAVTSMPAAAAGQAQVQRSRGGCHLFCHQKVYKSGIQEFVKFRENRGRMKLRQSGCVILLQKNFN
jgi:hypothetical protein